MSTEEKKDGYSWADLLADLQKLTPEQLQGQVHFYDDWEPLWAGKLLVPAEDYYYDADNKVKPESDMSHDVNEAGDVVHYANQPVLVPGLDD